MEDQAEEIARAIAAASAALDRALMGSDPDLVASHFTEDGVLGESGMEDLVGRPVIRDFLAKANTVRTVTYHRLHREELELLGDRAIERGRFDETKVKPGGPPIHERGRTVTWWRRDRDGAWRIARLVISDLPAEPR
jgi:uncharacterized protein (TIGR02246 family)